MKGKLFALSGIWLASLALQVSAHCPLCTVGAAAAAGGAAWLGVNEVVIGLFIGAFAMSMGWWIANLVKKKIIPCQKAIIILVSFLGTIIPLLPFMKEISPFYVSLMGEYGSWLNRTYVMNQFLAGSILGGFILCITPLLSSYIAKKRNATIPFQGTILSLSILIVIGAVIQWVL